MASEAEVIIGPMSDEPFWTVDVTDKTQLKRWTRLTLDAGGEIIEKSPQWTRFRIPADKLRFRVKHTRTLTEEQRDLLRKRLQQTRAAAIGGFHVFHTEIIRIRHTNICQTYPESS